MNKNYKKNTQTIKKKKTHTQKKTQRIGKCRVVHNMITYVHVLKVYP